MPRSPRFRKTLSNSAYRQLNLYALAASAAGYGVLVSPPAADASIVYTPTNIVLHEGSLPIDLNNDGVVDFVLLDQFRRKDNSNAFKLYANPVQKGNGVEGKSFRSVQTVNYGSPIGSQNAFAGRFMASFCTFNRTSTICLGGNWLTVSDRYLGLKFTIDGKTHFGWARLSVSYYLAAGITATLTGYAYETIPGKAIPAGATKGTDAAEPIPSLNRPTHNPATLGMLALGAPGLSVWMREESPSIAYDHSTP
jgi:hypothetical protein